MSAPRRPYDTVKRVLDVVCAGAMLVLLSPIMLLTALAILMSMGAPVVFKQERPGRDSRIFTLYKFRTMQTSAARSNALADVATDADRLTRVGRILRSTSLDELPQLWNVLVGDMSFIGPRPWLVEYLPHYSPTQARRHEVRPGITGWAQVNGRNAASWDDRMAMDVWYVDHRSLALDAKIVLLTVKAVFARSGVSAEGEATTRPFVDADSLDMNRQQESNEDRTDA